MITRPVVRCSFLVRRIPLLIALCSMPSLVAGQVRQVRVPFSGDSVSNRLRAGVRVLGPHGARSVNAAQQSVALGPGSYVAARMDSVAAPSRAPNGGAQIAIPIVFEGVNAAGRPVRLTPLIRMATGALRYDAQARVFSASLLVGLRSSGGAAAGQPIGQDIDMTMTTSAGTLDPAKLTIDRADDFQQVLMIVPAAGAPERVDVDLTAAFDPEPVKVQVPLVRRTLHLTATPEVVQGFGIGASLLAVRAEGLAAGETLSVVLSARSSRPVPAEVPVVGDKVSNAEIRSSWKGVDRVTAEASTFAPATLEVQYMFPWRFLIVTLFGALLGTAIRELYSHLNQLAVMGSHAIASTALGVLTGVLIAIANAVGVDIANLGLPQGIGGEAIVVVAAALGALASSTILKNRLPAREGAPQPAGKP